MLALNNELLEIAMKSALAGGRTLIDMKDKFGKPEYKGERDFVTKADKKAENEILSILRTESPHCEIITEESGNIVISEPNGYIWVVDPLDGTTNYCHSFPYYAVSIACIKDNQTICGVVFCPESNELFTASLEGGAYLNGTKLQANKPITLSGSMLATGFPYDISNDPLYNFDNLIILEKRVQAIRRLGSAAINLVYVACGRFDAYWESRLSPWDIAAGALIAKEAGSVVSNLQGDSFNPFDGSIVASNPSISGIILDIISKSSNDKWRSIMELLGVEIEGKKVCIADVQR